MLQFINMSIMNIINYNINITFEISSYGKQLRTVVPALQHQTGRIKVKTLSRRNFQNTFFKRLIS